jgi:hypothetical protein
MVDHTMLFTGSVRKMKDVVDSGVMGNRIEAKLASIHDHGIVVDARTGRVPRSEFPPQDTGPGLQIEEN